MRSWVLHMLELLDGGEIRRAAQHSRPEIDARLRIGSFDAVGRQISEGCIGHNNRVLLADGQEGDERAMPVDFVVADPHGGELEAIAEQAALADRLGGVQELLARRQWPIEQQFPMLGPELRVAGHRLVVEPGGLGRIEQDVGHAIFAGRDGVFVRFVAQDSGRAMRAAEGAAMGSMMNAGRFRTGPRLMHPAALRDPQSPLPFVTSDRLQQRDLPRQRQLFAKLPVKRMPPEQQAPGERQEVQIAREIRRLDRRGELRKWPEREQVSQPLGPSATIPNERFGPRRQGLILGQDSQPGAVQFGPFLIGRGQQSAEKFQPFMRGPLLAGGREKAPPEWAAWPLLAASEQGPPRPPLVVLRARQGQRQDDHVAFVGERADA